MAFGVQEGRKQRNGQRLQTLHEWSCGWMAARQQKHPHVVAKLYTATTADQVTEPVYRCSHCRPDVVGE